MTIISDAQLFDASFKAITGHAPLRWQGRLVSALLENRIPNAVDLPTGLGKTSVIAIWLIALAAQTVNGSPSLPRRLVYVVDRRTVVDQATYVAEQMRGSLRDERLAAGGGPLASVRAALAGLCIDPDDGASPLAISTLRGEHADNREWQADPARAAIIVGTIDMIGSRLLFEGYGVSRRMRPFHAGLLGQDTLLIHDEAHLSPAFGALVRTIAATQQGQGGRRALRVMELSATQRATSEGETFALDDDDRRESEVCLRIGAPKTLRLEPSPGDRSAGVAAMVDRALAYGDAQKRIAVYVRSPKDAREIAAALAKQAGKDNVALLTGTIRGRERDRLTKSELFRNFRPAARRDPPASTQYLVATSAGEVGVDLDADHSVCDLTTLDSMIQRLGRVNRLGRGAATAHVFELPRKGSKEDEPGDLDRRIAATKDALNSAALPDGGIDASPDALRRLLDRLGDEGIARCFSLRPRTAPLTDILLDTWSLTRAESLPGRPPVARWLHGVERDQPELRVAWRDEVDEAAGADSRVLKTLYDKHPINSREHLRGPLGEVLAELKKLAKHKTGQDSEEAGRSIPAILVPASGDPLAGALADLIERHEMRLAEATIVLPPRAGGLDEQGMLDAAEPYRDRATMPYDVADDALAADGAETEKDADTGLRRARVLLLWNAENERWSARRLGSGNLVDLDSAIGDARRRRDIIDAILKCLRGMALKAWLVLARDDDGEPRKVLVLLAPARSAELAEDDPAAAPKEQQLAEHLDWAHDQAEHIVRKTGLIAAWPSVAEAVVLAARLHDLGKNRAGWQKAIGHPPPREAQASASGWMPWAKSGRRGFDDSACGSYRHEFGSLREAADDPVIRDHPERDLILHLIASHHGWARPHFEPDHWDIADGVTDDENAAVAADAMRRFARLQRRFGHWGLAWLEALMRSADYAASKRIPDEPDTEPAGADVTGSPA